MSTKQLKKAEKKAVNSMYKDAPVSAALLPESHYFRTLADPFNVHGEKIPDSISYPSSTFTIVNRRVLTLGSDGNGAVAYGIIGNTGNCCGSLVPVIWLNDSVFTGAKTFGLGMITTGAGATSLTNLFSTSAGLVNNTFLPQWTDSTNAQGVPSLFKKTRLVSAGVAIEYLGTMLNAKGRMTIVSCPRNTFRTQVSSAGGVITLAQLQQQVDVKIIPINKLKAGTVTYHPIDLESFDYTDMDQKVDNTSQLLGMEQHLGGEFYIVIDGAEASATCQITEVFNYEGIARLGTLQVMSASPSRSDPIELSMAMNAIQDVPKTGTGMQGVQSVIEGSGDLKVPHQAPTSGRLHPTEAQREEEEEETFFEKVLDTGTELIENFAPGVVGKLTPMVGKAIKSLIA